MTIEIQQRLRKSKESWGHTLNIFTAKLEDIKEIAKGFNTYYLPRLNQDNAGNLKIPITPEKIESFTKSFK